MVLKEREGGEELTGSVNTCMDMSLHKPGGQGSNGAKAPSTDRRGGQGSDCAKAVCGKQRRGGTDHDLGI